MSYANGTQFYNLPQTVGTDKRDWFDTNSAFAAIDAALHSAVTGQASDAEAIATINGKLATDEADIAALQTKGNTHDSQIATLQTTVNAQAAQISDVRQDAEDMITANNEGAAATSTRAYAIGDYFIYNDVLYKATAAIAVGDTIVPNTNCEATNVDTELTQVKSDLSDSVAVESSNVNLTLKTNEANIITRSGGLSTVVVGFTITDVIAAAAELFNIPESMLKRATGTEDIYLPCIYYTSGNPTPMMLHLNAETGKVYRTTAFSAEGELLISATFPNNY